MRVRLTTDRATLLGPAQRDGDVIEVTDDEGQRLLASRQAVPVETATLAPPENAARRTQRPTRR